MAIDLLSGQYICVRAQRIRYRRIPHYNAAKGLYEQSANNATASRKLFVLFHWHIHGGLVRSRGHTLKWIRLASKFDPRLMYFRFHYERLALSSKVIVSAELLNIAADAGDATANYLLGITHFQKAEADASRATFDCAYGFLLRAVSLGGVDAMTSLGRHLMISGQERVGLSLLLRAARNGDAWAVALIVEECGFSLELPLKSRDSFIAYIRHQAVVIGNAGAVRFLARAYLLGQWGCVPDQVVAVRLNRRTRYKELCKGMFQPLFGDVLWDGGLLDKFADVSAHLGPLQQYEDRFDFVCVISE